MQHDRQDKDDMKRRRMIGKVAYVLCTLLSLGLAACGVSEREMRLRGEYTNIQNGDFLIFSLDGASDRVDTLHLQEGEFDYRCDLEGESRFCIVYPNNVHLMLWARGGDDLRIEGDAQDLWRVTVKGNEENELYTTFRQQNTLSDTTRLRQSAARLIRSHPTSAVSRYLLSQYFVIPTDVSPDSVNALYQVIRQALPTSPEVATLGGGIRQRNALRVGQPMTDFDLVTTDSVHHRLSSYKGKTLVLYFWAGWQGSSAYLQHELLKLKRERTDSLRVGQAPSLEFLSYSLDTDSVTLRANRPAETDGIPVYCDYTGFSSPLASQLGIRTVPLILVVDAQGKIRAVCQDMTGVRKALKGAQP